MDIVRNAHIPKVKLYANAHDSGIYVFVLSTKTGIGTNAATARTFDLCRLFRCNLLLEHLSPKLSIEMDFVSDPILGEYRDTLPFSSKAHHGLPWRETFNSYSNLSSAICTIARH